jgi:hypothetical protein
MPTTGSFYNAKGNKIVAYLAAAPVSLAAPTQVELTAGTDVTCEIDPAGISGFSVSTSNLSNPTLCSTFEAQTPDTRTPDDSSMVFYAKYSIYATFDLFPEGDTGYIAILPEGQAATRLSEIWPVQVTSRTWLHETGTQKYRIDFAITGEPVQGIQAA